MLAASCLRQSVLGRPRLLLLLLLPLRSAVPAIARHHVSMVMWLTCPMHYFRHAHRVLAVHPLELLRRRSFGNNRARALGVLTGNAAADLSRLDRGLIPGSGPDANRLNAPFKHGARHVTGVTGRSGTHGPKVHTARHFPTRKQNTSSATE